MLTPKQELELRKYGKEKGYSQEKINAFIAEKKSEGKKSLFDFAEIPKKEGKKGDGFLKSALKDPIKTLIVKPGVRIAQAGIAGYGALSGNQRALDFSTHDLDLDTPFGKYTIEGQKAGLAGAKQILGDAARAGSYLYTPGGAKAVGGVFNQGLRKTAAEGAKAGAITGGLYSGGNALQENKSLKDTVLETAKGAATGGVIGGVAAGVFPGTQIGLQKGKDLYGSKIKPNIPKTDSVTKFGKDLFLGEDLNGALSQLAKNKSGVASFKNGVKTIQDVADTITKTAGDFENKSFQTFQKMKNSLPQIKIPNTNLVGEVKKTINDLPTLTPKEKPLVQDMLKLISNNKKTTVADILNLRNRLDRGGFFRAGEDYVNSNRALTQIRNKLNEMAITRVKNYDLKNGTKYANDLIQGLKKASSDIEFIDTLKSNIIGHNNTKYLEQTANKLRSIISKIDDPIEYEATKNLLKELEGRTKTKIINELESAKAAQIIKKYTKLPGGINPLQSVGVLINKAAVKGVENLSK